MKRALIKTLSLVASFVLLLAAVPTLAVYGATEFNDSMATDSTYLNPCIEALDTNYNLLGSDYVIDTEDNPGTIMLSGNMEGASAKVAVYSTNSDNDLVNHSLEDIHADIKGVTFSDGSAFKSNTYVDISIALMYEATIEKFFIAHSLRSYLRTSEFELYTSQSLSTLYNSENCRWHYTNSASKQYQVYIFSEPVTAKYVGIRILKSIPTPTSIAANSSNARLAEIALFGKYNVDYFDYTVKSEGAPFIDIADSVYGGKTIELSAPLTKDGYSFRGWTLNGESMEHTVNKYDNLTEAEVKITEDSEIKAIYTSDDSEFTGNSVYGVSPDKTKVRVPQNHVFYEVRYGMNQYPLNISGMRGTAALEDKDILKKGDTLVLSSNGTRKQTAEVAIAGDFDNNGAVEVTDIVSGVEAMLNGNATEEECFLFDSNNSGTLTVSDIIFARNTVLNTPDTLTDYSHKTVAMKDAVYKKTGRNIVGTDGSLYVEMTAAGFSFNADCYGDIKLTIQQTHSDRRYYTVIVDGVESEVFAIGNQKQELVIAKGLSSEPHTIEVYKQSEGGNGVTIHDISINGEFLEAPKDKEMLIEFVGDSITCGLGNLVKNGETLNVHSQNGYKAYGTQTAAILGADWSNISSSGSALVNISGMANAHMPTRYKQVVSSKTDLWNFSANRNADIVVVNLGTNDNGVLTRAGYTTDAQKKEIFSAAAYDFAKQIIEANGEDVKIVFAFGLMTPTPNVIDTSYLETIQKLKDEDGYTNAYYCRLPTNREGGDYHPTVEGDAEAAEVLSAFIKDTVLK